MAAATADTGAGFRAASRLRTIEISEILRITAEAAGLKRAGRPMIVLGAGEPDFDTPDHIEDAAVRAFAAGATRFTALDRIAAACAQPAVRRPGPGRSVPGRPRR